MAASSQVAHRVRLVRASHLSLIQSSAFLVVQMGFLAVTGFAFWLIAARRFEAETVGRASALYTLVLVAHYAGNLGVPVVVARFGSASTGASRNVFAWSILAATVAAALTSFVVAILASDTFAEPLLVHGRLLGGVMFFFAVLGLALTGAIDNRQLGLGYRRNFLLRNVVFSGIRLPLILLIAATSGSFWVWFSVVIGAPTTALLGLIIERNRIGPYRPEPIPNRREVQRYASVNYASVLLSQAPFVVAPLIVLTTVAPEENAAFHVVWSIAATIFLVPNILGRALLIEGSMDHVTLQAQTRLMLWSSAAFGVGALGLAIPWAILVPHVYGDAYARSGTYLVLLIAAAVPFAITSSALNVARVRSDTRATLLISTSLALGVAIPAAIFAQASGAEGVTVAWVVGHCVAAGISAFTLLPVLRDDVVPRPLT